MDEINYWIFNIVCDHGDMIHQMINYFPCVVLSPSPVTLLYLNNLLYQTLFSGEEKMSVGHLFHFSVNCYNVCEPCISIKLLLGKQ